MSRGRTRVGRVWSAAARLPKTPCERHPRPCEASATASQLLPPNEKLGAFAQSESACEAIESKPALCGPGVICS